MAPLKPSLSEAALASLLKSGAPPTNRDSFRLRAVCWFWNRRDSRVRSSSWKRADLYKP